MTLLTPPGLYDGYRVRVMWERPVGIWDYWPLTRLYARPPIYVFIAYVHGWERPVRIGLRGDRGKPFIIDDPLAFDGGPYDHGPHANSIAYDDGTKAHSLAGLFDMLYRSARNGTSGLPRGEQPVLNQALDEFYTWIWREDPRFR